MDLRFVLPVFLTVLVGGSYQLQETESGHLEELAVLQSALRNVTISPPTLLDRFHKLQETPRDSWDESILEYMNCTLAMIELVNGIRNFELWALRMVDASSKIPTGLLEGNLLDLGQFEECLDVDKSDSYPPFQGQHCLVRLILSLPGLADKTININGENVHIVDLLGGTDFTLTISQCLPSSCKPYMIAKGFDELFLPINIVLAGQNMTLVAAVADKDCHVADRGSLRTEEWIVVAVCAFFVLLAIICSSLDGFYIKDKKPSSAERVVQAFSVQRNFKKLFSAKDNADQMGAINGMKFFSIAWVVLGHRYRYAVQQPLVNLLEVPNMMRDWTKMFLLNATLSVDTFFLISGLLNAYGFFTLMDVRRRYTIQTLLFTYVHRYIRLTPAYMLMIAITGTWLWRVGNGPIWDRLVGEARDNCQMTWWSNIIYLNNYLNPNHNCMMQSWYLAADMQMYWLAPFVLYPMWRWPIFGFIELLILTLASIASPFAVSYIFKITEPIPLSNNEEKVNKEMDVLYLPTHTKTIAYVVGIFAGYILQKARTKKIRLPLNWITCTIGWLICAIFMLYALFGCYWLFQADNPYTQLESSLYLGFYRFFWAVGVAWVILACVMGRGGFINKWLSWKQFGPLGRLTYCIYLTHIAVILYKMGSIKTAMFLSDYDQVEQFIGDLFFAMICATILSLLLESPVLILEKLIFGTGRRERRTSHRRSDPENTAPSAPLPQTRARMEN